jgi:hypothetical protein
MDRIPSGGFVIEGNTTALTPLLIFELARDPGVF